MLTYFEEAFPDLSPIVAAIINSSLLNGVAPATLEHATVHPLLKKHHLDQHLFQKSWTKSSTLKFHLTLGIFDPFQSGFREQHSTESAICAVL